MSVGVYAQNITVKGHVKDALGGVIGANVIEKGNPSNGTITDVDGNFTLSVPKGAILQVSFIGYKTQEIEATSSVIVTLKDDSELLNEVVVIGYGVAKKNDLTGSVTAIKPDEKNKGLVVSAQDMIQGKIAGVNVNTTSGAPGEGAQIRIRGGASLNASNNPLIVIDGMPMDNNNTKGVNNPLSLVNPNDIETFTVLKDASATAIYGSRGSNGVIIITTKKGRKNQAPKVSYNGTLSVSTIADKLDVMNAPEYVEFIKNTYGEGSAAYAGLGWQKYNEDGTPKNELKEGESRFFKLSNVDTKYENSAPEEITNTFTLEEFCNQFRNYSASRLHLYYDINLIRLFIASFASNKLIILEGISGTGKTSLAYAFGSFVDNETTVASVQPSWRDSTEIFGYFNEFTKKFNETEILEKMYEAQYNDEVYITLLDEMNISRVEYYFAEMLSILELPNKKDWVVELVPNVWPDDPKKLENGKLKIPENMWYIGTINNDDSTFMITDKVYDRAMPIAIDDKCEVFEAPDTDKIKTSYKHLEGLFEKSSEEHPVSEENLEKIAQLDRYVIDHFRLAFGNRIVKQLKEFVPAFIACGGDEVAGIDYLIAHKILRKFEQLNLAYIKDEIDGLVNYLEKLFGTGKTPECKAYLLRLKKTI